MNYYLHHDGRDLGMFPLEELQRRRQSGELSGAEFVWREGMTEWQPLDSVLQGTAHGRFIPPPLPAATAKKTGTRQVAWIAAIAVLVVLVGITLMAIVATKLIRRARLPGNSEGVELAGKSVALTTNSATEEDARKRGRDFRRRLWLEGYKERAERNRPCDADAAQMIEAWIDANFAGPKTNAQDIAQWCDKLAAMPTCDDPLVLTITGLNAIELHERSRRLERALAGFPQSQHTAYPRLNAAVTLIETTSDTNRVNALFGAAVRSMRECFADGSFRPDDQAEIAEIFIHGWGYNFFYRIRDSVYQSPRAAGQSFEWLALVFEGEFHVMEAWKERGGGYANTVTAQGWEGFRKHLAAARKSFSSAWTLRPDLPLAPCRMISVAMGESSVEEMRVWFDRTVAAQIDYPNAWSEMRWALRPRWHGSLEAMLALGKSAVDTGRFDTDVPRKFFDAVSDLESELEMLPGQHIYGRSDIWPNLARMYEGYIAEPSLHEMQPGWRSTYAAVAYLGGKYDVARTQLEAIRWEPWLANLSGWGIDLSLMPFEVAARTGSAATKVSAAENSYRRSNVADALQRYHEIAALTDLDAHTSKFVQSRLAVLDLEKRLASGEWVNLLPSGTNDPAWVVSVGAVRPLTNGLLEVRADKYGHLLFSRARVGMNFQVRGEFEILESSTKDFQAGLVMGLPSFHAMDWYAFRMKRNADEGQVASFSRAWTRQEVAKPIALIHGTNSFEFQFQNGRATAAVNDSPVLREVEPPKSSARISSTEFLVGLGAYNDMNETVLRYHTVQVRRLPTSGGRPPKIP